MRIKKFTKYVKLYMYTYFRQPSTIIIHIFKLYFETISKFSAFYCAYLSFSNKGQSKFDSEAAEEVLDIG